MPRKATDKGQQVQLQLGLLLQTTGQQIHFVTLPAVLWAINFVPGSFLRPPSCPLVFFVSLMLLTSEPTPFPCLVLSLHHEIQVSGVCVCMCLRACVCVLSHWFCVTWDQVTVEHRKREGYSSGSLRYCWLIGWGVSQANRLQSLKWLTGERNRGEGSGRVGDHRAQHTCHCLSQKQRHLHLFTNTHTHTRTMQTSTLFMTVH